MSNFCKVKILTPKSSSQYASKLHTTTKVPLHKTREQQIAYVRDFRKYLSPLVDGDKVRLFYHQIKTNQPHDNYDYQKFRLNIIQKLAHPVIPTH